MSVAQSAPPRLSSLQQERSRETRRRLIQAATRLWLTNGFDETTVSAVCDEAGVSKGTFYFYFLGKEDLLLELAVTTSERVWQDWERLAESDKTTDWVFREIVASISQRVQRTPRHILSRTVHELLRSWERWAAVRGARKDFASVYLAAFTRGQERKEISSKYDPRELASMQTIMTLRAMLAWAEKDEEPLKDVLWRWTQTLLHGAAPRPKK